MKVLEHRLYHARTKAVTRRHTMSGYYQYPQYPQYPHYPMGSFDHSIHQHEQAVVMQIQYGRDALIVPPCGGHPRYLYFQPAQPYPQQYVDVRKSYISDTDTINRERRKEANRQSARRSKLRKKNAELAVAAGAAALQEKNKILRDRIHELLPCAKDLLEQNYKLREELGLMLTSTDGLYEPDMPPPVEIPASTLCHITKITKADEDIVKDVTF